jgi:hypothetical protein
LASSFDKLRMRSRVFNGLALMPNLNTTFRELVDLKKELAKFMPAWRYALGGRGAF